MQRAELTLEAALRDASASRTEPRAKAIRNLAPALLEALDEPSPSWEAANRHPSGPAVVETLIGIAQDDPDPMIRGTAALGLGQLGEAQVLPLVESWPSLADDAPGAVFQRECALIAISFVGACAPRTADARSLAIERLRAAVHSDHPDVRFQAAAGLVEVLGNEAEPDLVEALGRETHDDVREGLVDAMGKLDPPGAAACEALAALLDDEAEAGRPIGFEAAMALASAKRPEAGPRLVMALRLRSERDRALEALAFLGRAAPGEAVEAVDRLASGWLTPGITRVRAAYALVRMVAPTSDRREHPGQRWLDRLALHPRAAVREAVADARAALAQLDLG